MTDKPTKDQIEANPEHYKLLKGGAVYGLQEGRIVAHLAPSNGPFQITRANARQMQRRGRLVGLRSVLKGLVDAAREKGVQLPDPDTLTDEELEAAGGDAIRLITKHTALTYLDSKNLRGMGEVYNRLTFPLTGQEDEEEVPHAVMRGFIHELADALRRARDESINGDVIDAE
jgi:hypothetical protein